MGQRWSQVQRPRVRQEQGRWRQFTSTSAVVERRTEGLFAVDQSASSLGGGEEESLTSVAGDWEGT